jgi:hypothetical protein
MGGSFRLPRIIQAPSGSVATVELFVGATPLGLVAAFAVALSPVAASASAAGRHPDIQAAR